jgi:HEAT repeat protein
MAEPLRRLSVFLASPGDLAEERRLAKVVVESANRIARQLGWYVELLVWEDTRPAFARPQAVINRDVDTCDLFVGLLWERWGQPTGEYSSGFEEEFERARARRLATGAPDIWLIFKTIDPSKLRDPGDELKRVLKFKQMQEDRKELLFKGFATPEEWRSNLLEWLPLHLVELAQERGKVPTPTQAATPELSESTTGSILAPTGAPPEPVTVSVQLRESTRRLHEVVAEGDLATAPDILEGFQIARLNLLTKSLIVGVDRRIVLDILEIHSLYPFHKRVELAGTEPALIFRTLISDRFTLAAGWYWLRGLEPEEAQHQLLVACLDGSVEVRKGAVTALTELRLDPEETVGAREGFLQLLVADDSEDVSAMSLAYLGAIGTLADLPFIERRLEDGKVKVREAAAKARFAVLARHEPARAFELLLAGDRGAEDKKELEKRADVLTPSQLKEAFVSGNAQARQFAAEELRRRRQLSPELAKSLLTDSSAVVRAVAFEELIRQGVSVTVDDIDNAFKNEKAPTLAVSLLGGLSVDKDEIIFKLFSTYTIERLRSETRWLFGANGEVAYRVLGLRHFEEMGGQIRRDLRDEFKSLKAETAAKMREDFGAAGEEAWRVLWERDPRYEEFERTRYTAVGLEALAEYGSPEDVELARRYIGSRHEDVQIQASRILMRFGTRDDVGALMSIAKEGYGRRRQVAAEAALKLSPGPQGAAVSMLDTASPILISVALKALEDVEWSAVRDVIRGLLHHSDELVRVKAISYLVERLSAAELQKILDDSLELPHYYYNVICWLDRVLHAPSPLKNLYRSMLNQRGFRATAEY